MPQRQCQYHGYFGASEATIFFVAAGVSPARSLRREPTGSPLHAFCSRASVDDFLEARIAAEQVPERVQF